MTIERVKRPSMRANPSPKAQIFSSPAKWEPRSYACAIHSAGVLGHNGCDGFFSSTPPGIPFEEGIICRCWCHREEDLQEALEGYSFVTLVAGDGHRHQFADPNDNVPSISVFLTCVRCKGVFLWPDGDYTGGDGLWGMENYDKRRDE